MNTIDEIKKLDAGKNIIHKPKRHSNKKIIKIFCTVLILFLPAMTLYNCNSTSSINERNGMYGNVKTVDEKSFDMQFNEMLLYHNVYEYDTDGKCIYSKDGNFSYKYFYDDKGKIIEKEYIEKDRVPNTSGSEYYSYDDNGNFVSSYYFFQGEKIESKKNIKYDKNGKTLWEVQETTEFTYKYDSKGNKSEEIQEYISNNHKFITKYNFEYKNGRRIKCTISFTNSDGDTRESEEFYKYDKFNEIEMKVTNPDGTFIIKTEYDYDGNNNWVRKTQYRDGKVYREWRREIQYY